MPVHTRPARLGEVAELNALIEQSVRQLSVAYYAPAQIDSALRYVFGVDTQLIIDGTYYVAEIDGHLAGCGGWSRRHTLYGGDQHKVAADPLLDPAQDAARIRAFFVHPSWARQGVGRAILAVCEAAARQAGFQRLELAATLPGEPLYAALGYAAGARLSPVLPDGQTLPIVQMHKQL
ncbi:GNAT family N-acetyltransferase [Hymenobacter cheonanensis]|uniref:GNAT family N-acetyltransferase n=1 Tax=Hymenobacter sp. CA2-7 TaxID=3063993 RepID=UPI0027143BBA|nr:GNAT family N-acetyltransferase [Hymenobacter sp. CA2-7]MDO7885617.1 GNAT family N-acetyltransferase [Hymenobacter sp. CA2-7]